MARSSCRSIARPRHPTSVSVLRTAALQSRTDSFDRRLSQYQTTYKKFSRIPIGKLSAQAAANTLAVLLNNTVGFRRNVSCLFELEAGSETSTGKRYSMQKLGISGCSTSAADLKTPSEAATNEHKVFRFLPRATSAAFLIVVLQPRACRFS